MKIYEVNDADRELVVAALDALLRNFDDGIYHHTVGAAIRCPSRGSRLWWRKKSEFPIIDYRQEQETDCYYLRVELEDGRCGWTSPIWAMEIPCPDPWRFRAAINRRRRIFQ